MHSLTNLIEHRVVACYGGSSLAIRRYTHTLALIKFNESTWRDTPAVPSISFDPMEYSADQRELMVQDRAYCQMIFDQICEAMAERIAIAILKRQEADRIRAEERAAANARNEQRAAAQAAKREELHEILKWQLGDFIKLTRHGYRATVFGTIDNVRSYGMSITTEKGKHMEIYYNDIIALDVRDPDAKKGQRNAYTNLYTEKN